MIDFGFYAGLMVGNIIGGKLMFGKWSAGLAVGVIACVLYFLVQLVT